MMKRDGKMNFTGILIILIICYGAFVAYKFIMVRVEKAEIKTDVVNQLGTMRGQDFTIDAGVEAIYKILKEQGIANETERIRVETDGDDGPTTSFLNDNDDDASKAPPRIIISLRYAESKSKLIISIKYDTVVDLIFFKTKQDVDIEEDVLTYS